MQNIVVIFSILFCSFNFAFAQSQPLPKVVNNPDQPTSVTRARNYLLNSRFEVGITNSYHKYEEPGLMKIKGVQFGANFAYNWYDKNESFRIRPEVEILRGTFNYDGQSCMTVAPFTCTPLKAKGTETYLNLSGTIGKLYKVNSSMFTIFGGLAQRYLDNNIKGTGSYQREITYFYAPVGGEFATLFADKTLRLRFGLEYDLFIYGIVVSHLEDVGYSTLTNHQTKGFGAKSLVALDWTTDSMTLSFQPFVQYWRVEDSDIGTATGPSGTLVGHEPKNTTFTGGMNVSYLF